MTTQVRETLSADTLLKRMAAAETWGRLLMQKHNATPLLSVEDVINAVNKPGGAYLGIVSYTCETMASGINLPVGVQPAVHFVPAYHAEEIAGARDLQKRFDSRGEYSIHVPVLRILYDSKRPFGFLSVKEEDGKFPSKSPLELVFWEQPSDLMYDIAEDTINNGIVNQLPQALVKVIEDAFSKRWSDIDYLTKQCNKNWDAWAELRRRVEKMLDPTTTFV